VNLADNASFADVLATIENGPRLIGIFALQQVGELRQHGAKSASLLLFATGLLGAGQ